jgi:hypothetical protein
MKILISLLLLLHAILHLLGLVKAFYDDFLPAISRVISKSEGILWLACAVLLFIANVYFLMDYTYWPVLAIIGALLSQFLITLNWEDAKFGTILNLLILAISFPALV